MRSVLRKCTFLFFLLLCASAVTRKATTAAGAPGVAAGNAIGVFTPCLRCHFKAAHTPEKTYTPPVVQETQHRGIFQFS